MPFYYGSLPVTLKYGSHPITHLYKGSTLIWTPGGIRDPFDGSAVLNPAWWAQEGSSYSIGSEFGLCRLLLPDNAIWIFAQTAHARYTAAQHQADGYAEWVIGNPGSGGFATTVWRRASNASGRAAGVGVQMLSSSLQIVRRVGGVETEVRACGQFQGGDRMRLTQVGNLHTVHRNGRFVGEWDDTGATAANTFAERTLAMTMTATKDLFGPRRFSPSIDWIECR